PAGAALAYFILQSLVMRQPESGPRLRAAFVSDLKGRLSPVLYLLGIGLALVEPKLGLVPFIAVAVIWLVPDRRIERYLERERAEA
ncbi:MAG: hypothetical protein ABI873_03740, partial [Marmoricola sp.]